MLYQKQVTSDRSKTQLAYKLRYWPGHMLGTEARKFCTVRSPTTVTKQRLEDMLGADALVIEPDCNRLGGLQKTLGAIGEFFEIHVWQSLLSGQR